VIVTLSDSLIVILSDCVCDCESPSLLALLVMSQRQVSFPGITFCNPDTIIRGQLRLRQRNEIKERINGLHSSPSRHFFYFNFHESDIACRVDTARSIKAITIALARLPGSLGGRGSG